MAYDIIVADHVSVDKNCVLSRVRFEVWNEGKVVETERNRLEMLSGNEP